MSQGVSKTKVDHTKLSKSEGTRKMLDHPTYGSMLSNKAREQQSTK